MRERRIHTQEKLIIAEKTADHFVPPLAKFYDDLAQSRWEHSDRPSPLVAMRADHVSDK